ncbi:MAG: type II toxin-antitoxin system death-on-curing family toxin [Candidatus Delongbacteria bacterium]
MQEPVWIPRLVIDAIHVDQIREHGGLAGIRDTDLLESALARPKQKWAYDQNTDLAALAAAYCFGIAKNHPFQDGNKRVGLLALIIFLGLNDQTFLCGDESVVTTIIGLASGQISEEALSAWIRANATSSPR